VNLGALSLLVLATMVWVALPLLPALRELLRPTDASPLMTVGRDNADIARFARHFRQFAERQVQALLPADDATARLPDGTELVRVTSAADLLRAQGHRLVVLDQPIPLLDGAEYLLEVWARSEMTGGSGCVYRALLGDHAVHLGPRSVVLRWVHAVGVLRVGKESHLYGRASSESGIVLDRAVGFDRLGAPVVAAGESAPAAMPLRDPGMLTFKPPETSRRLGPLLRIEGDCTVPSGSVLEGDVVVAGRLRVLEGARLAGSLKAHGAIELHPNVVVEGSLVSRKEIVVGTNCWLRGPVISEEHLHLGRGTTVGTPNAQTTVSGRTVSLAMGAVVCGHVVTQEGGQTAE
jgi:cytoskeletal protein CcmA (bactofilin family)